jgi:hypothetical protein
LVGLYAERDYLTPERFAFVAVPLGTVVGVWLIVVGVKMSLQFLAKSQGRFGERDYEAWDALDTGMENYDGDHPSKVTDPVGCMFVFFMLMVAVSALGSL